MNYSRIQKISFLLITSLFILNTFSIAPTTAASEWNSTLSWDAQAAGCQPVSGNINGVLNYVYLGTGNNSVPTALKAQYPQASSSYLEYWKTEMVGLTLNKLKSFVIPSGKGYTSGQLAYQALYFETTILQILNDVNNSGITTRSSLVNVQYSLYTGCQKPSGGILGGIIPYNNSTPLLLGILVGIGILAVVGYVVYSGRNPNLNTEKIIKKTQKREEENIKSLKNTLDIKKEADISNHKKQSSVRRRR